MQITRDIRKVAKNCTLLLTGDFIGKAVSAFYELHKVNAWLNEALHD
jgi:hypothetical protein